MPGSFLFFMKGVDRVSWILVLALGIFLYPMRPMSRKVSHVLNVYFGVPGSGKTTFAAWLTKQCLKESLVIKAIHRWPDNPLLKWLVFTFPFRRAIPVWSNVPITGAYKLDPQHDIGRYMICEGKIIIDEAGIEYNNRSYKTFPAEAIYFYKYHRHYMTSVDIFSQSYDDMDVTLRRLAQHFYVVKKSIVPFCVTCRLIRRKVGVDDQTHQIADLYSMGLPLLHTRRIFCPSLWKMFNSYSRKEFPNKDWERW